MASICGCAQRRYGFISPNQGGLFRTCEQCGTAWVFTGPGWWKLVEDKEPAETNLPEAYPPTLPQEFRNDA